MEKAAFAALLGSSSVQYKPGIPALALDEPARGKRIVSYGDPGEKTLMALAREHATVTRCESVVDVMRLLAWSTFDAILVVPEMEDALLVAKALKLGAAVENQDEVQWHAAALRHRRKPVFVLPFCGDVEYAVIVAAPSLAYLERTSRYPIATAIVRFEASKLFPHRGNDGAGIA